MADAAAGMPPRTPLFAIVHHKEVFRGKETVVSWRIFRDDLGGGQRTLVDGVKIYAAIVVVVVVVVSSRGRRLISAIASRGNRIKQIIHTVNTRPIRRVHA